MSFYTDRKDYIEDTLTSGNSSGTIPRGARTISIVCQNDQPFSYTENGNTITIDPAANGQVSEAWPDGGPMKRYGAITWDKGDNELVIKAYY